MFLLSVDVKGNDGRAGRRRRTVRILFRAGLGLALLAVITALARAMIGARSTRTPPAGVRHPRERRRGRGRGGRSATAVVNNSGPATTVGGGGVGSDRKQSRAAEAAILHAEYHLINIHIRRGSMTNNGTYSRVDGLFCPLDFSLQKDDPTAVPMAKDMVSKSKRCERETHSVDLRTIVAKARAFDADADDGEPSLPAGDGGGGKKVVVPSVRSLPVGGCVFHESRSGSTLISNVLAAVRPSELRVHSEATPPIHALRACEDFDDGGGCGDGAAAELLRDVVYMMGRSADPAERRQFFKVQSIGTTNLNVFTEAFPNVPWIFVYRHPVQVMMSYWRDGNRSSSVCLRGYHSGKDGNLPGHHSSEMLVDLIESKLGRGAAVPGIGVLTKEQYCAANLASFCEAAIRELGRTSGGSGRLVNYEGLKNSLLDSVLPHHFRLEIGEVERRRAERVFEVYSKRRRGRLVGNDSRQWVEDSSKKEDAATETVKRACQEFLWDAYNTLESLSANQNSLVPQNKDWTGR